MELLARARARVALALAVAAAVAGWAAPAADAQLKRPSSQTEPPKGFRLSAKRAITIADRSEKVRAERRGHRIVPTAYTNGQGRWQVSYFEGGEDRGKERVQVQVDDRAGAVIEAWSGHHVVWTMARGYEGAFGRKINAPYIWLPLCLLFLLPFIDPRRPFRLLHLDLLVLLAFGVSHVFFNRGEVSASVPLVYPVLLYLLVRVLAAGFRPRERAGPIVPFAPALWLLAGIAFLVAFRIGLNVADSNVIDVGYSGVIGADRIADGDELYGAGFDDENERGDTYGPFNYLAYVPFEQALPWSGSWDDLPAAHAAAIAFDLLTMLCLLLLGRRLRPGGEGRLLGLALAYAWAAYPYTAFVLASNANDSLVALLVALALLGATGARARSWASAAGRGVAVGLGAASKFGPLLLAPLLAATGRSWRSLLVFGLALVGAICATVLPFVPDGGLDELYDRSFGYQAGRDSPFSLWGQTDSLEWLHTGVKAAAVALALLVAFVPRSKTPRQVAALAAAVLIAVQLGVTHWFYLYVVWFVPPLFVAVFAANRQPPPAAPPTGPDEKAVEPALA